MEWPPTLEGCSALAQLYPSGVAGIGALKQQFIRAVRLGDPSFEFEGKLAQIRLLAGDIDRVEFLRHTGGVPELSSDDSTDEYFPVSTPVGSSLGPDLSVRRTFTGANVRAPGPSDSGYCYLHLVREDHRASALEGLGKNPWAAQLAGWLVRFPGGWARGSFGLRLGGPRVDAPDPRGFQQLHLLRSDCGFTVKEFVLFGFPNCRVGADGELRATDAAATGGKSVLALRPDRHSTTLSFPVAAMFTHLQAKGKAVVMDPRRMQGIVDLIRHFESAELASVDFDVTVMGENTTNLYCGVYGAGSEPKSEADWVSLPIMAVVSGDSERPKAVKFGLPPDHSFGRELRGVAVGNLPPVFAFGLFTNEPAKVLVRGTVRLKVAGQGVSSALNFSPGQDGSVLAAVQQR